MFRSVHRSAFIASSLALVGLAALPLLSSATSRAIVSRVDVAMDPTSFSFEGDINENGVPAAGTPFVIQGYIYPGGTFERFGADRGVLLDGRPEFPELVMGTWTCRGWHLLDGDASQGVGVATTQTFDLDPRAPGAELLVTDGVELAEFGRPFSRAVTGGTGRFRGARGEHRQVLVGTNQAGAFNVSFDMNILPGNF